MPHLSAGLGQLRVAAPRVCGPERLAEHADPAGGAARGLVSVQADLAVPVAVQGALVDVGRAEHDVRVVNHHQLRVDVDGVAERLPHPLHQGTLLGRVQALGQLLLGLPLAETVEVEVVPRVGLGPHRLDGGGHALVHGGHGAVLPVQDLLAGVRAGVPLGVHRDADVDLARHIGNV